MILSGYMIMEKDRPRLSLAGCIHVYETRHEAELRLLTLEASRFIADLGPFAVSPVTLTISDVDNDTGNTDTQQTAGTDGQ